MKSSQDKKPSKPNQELEFWNSVKARAEMEIQNLTGAIKFNEAILLTAKNELAKLNPKP